MNLGNGEFLGNMPSIPERNRRRRDGLPGRLVGGERLAALPGEVGGSLAAGVRELDADRGLGKAPAGLDDARHRGFVVGGLEAGASVRDPALGGYPAGV